MYFAPYQPIISTQVQIGCLERRPPEKKSGNLCAPLPIPILPLGGEDGFFLYIALRFHSTWLVQKTLKVIQSQSTLFYFFKYELSGPGSCLSYDISAFIQVSPHFFKGLFVADRS